MSKRRVVVTGLGVVSSLGIGWKDFWANLLAGKSGISEVDYFDTTGYDRKVAGQVKDFDPQRIIAKSRIPYLGRASQFAIAATKMAIKDAGLTKKSECLRDAGVFIGTTMGEPQIMEEQDEACWAKEEGYKMCPKYAIRYPSSNISAHVALEFSLKGMSGVFANACAAGNFATGYASDLIRTGRSNMMIVGGTDAFSRIAFTGFHRLVAIASDVCRPFDKNRTGMIPAEGAGILIVEELEHAKKRGAKIYAEILGYGAACESYHMTQPEPRGGVKAIARALADAGIKPADVDYISAHGTATPENDKAECEVFYEIFGERIKDIPASSIKSMLGHTMGAASALESIVCCLAIKDGKIPPTINYETPDPECDIDCVPNKFRSHKVNIALNNSLAFGGNDFCVIFQRG